MLEQGLSHYPPVPLPAAGARDLHDLDVLSEITALSEAAGVRPRPADDRVAFLRKVARAQGASLAGLQQAHEDQQEAEQEEFDATGTDADEAEHSPFPEADDEAEHSPFPEADDEAEATESDDG